MPELTKEDLALRILELQQERDLLLAACRTALGLLPDFPHSPFARGEREKIVEAVRAVGQLPNVQAGNGKALIDVLDYELTAGPEEGEGKVPGSN